MPDSWDLGTVRVKFYYLNTDITASKSNVFGVTACAISRTDLISEGSYATEVTVSNVVAASTNAINVATSPALTIGGTPALGDLIIFRIARRPDNGWDNNEADVRLLGVALQYQDKRNNPAEWVHTQ